MSIESAVLIPRRRQPISRQGDRQRTADYETEVSRTGRSYDRAVCERCELLNDLRRLITIRAQSVAADLRQKFFELDTMRHRAGRDSIKELIRQFTGAGQKLCATAILIIAIGFHHFRFYRDLLSHLPVNFNRVENLDERLEEQPYGHDRSVKLGAKDLGARRLCLKSHSRPISTD